MDPCGLQRNFACTRDPFECLISGDSLVGACLLRGFYPQYCRRIGEDVASAFLFRLLTAVSGRVAMSLRMWNSVSLTGLSEGDIL